MARSCFRGASGGSVACPSQQVEKPRYQDDKDTVPMLGTYNCNKTNPKKRS
jgi:hypothetical protein